MRRRFLFAALIAAVATGGAAAAVTAAGDAGSHPAANSRNAQASVPAGARYRACLAHDAVTFASRTAGASAALVPGRPQAVLLCRYSGLNARPPLTLVAHRLLNAAATTSLARELNALPRKTGLFQCPVDVGTAVVAFFRYRAMADDPVKIGLSGCQQVSNGHLNRLAGATRRHISAQLDGLTP